MMNVVSAGSYKCEMYGMAPAVETQDAGMRKLMRPHSEYPLNCGTEWDGALTLARARRLVLALQRQSNVLRSPNFS